MREPDSVGPYRVVPFLLERNATLDTLRWAKRRLQVPVLLEIDVTSTRKAIRTFRNRTGQGLSFTAWVVSCIARAAAEHPRVHAVRQGKRRLVVFGEVDVTVLVERSVGEESERETLPMPVVIRKANEKAPSEIHEEIRWAQNAEVSPSSSSIEQAAPPWLQALFFRLPSWLRDSLFWRWLLRSPMRMKRTMGTVVVSSAGMAAPGILSWGVPLSLHPLAVAVGGITQRRGEGENTDVLALTVVFDHAVTDGAPVGRFIHCLTELLTRAESLLEPDPGSG